MTSYRAATPADRAFVIATWASSYKGAHAAGMISTEDWPAIMHVQIAKLLDRPGTRTIVAYDPSDDDDFLYGFIAGDVTGHLPVVYYVYVKGPYRSEMAGKLRSGPRHARGLFAALGVDPEAPFLYTCRTSVVTRLGHKIRNARFAPAAARYTNYQEERHEHDQ
jgi:hypothetical protein